MKKIIHNGDVAWCECPCHHSGGKDVEVCKRGCWTQNKPLKVCTHWELKVRKHRENQTPCLHCLGCGATWSDPVRAMNFLRKAKKIVFWSRYEI